MADLRVPPLPPIPVGGVPTGRSQRFRLDAPRRGHEVLETGYSYKPDNMYRVLGQDGWAAARREGKFNAHAGNKFAALQETYYNQGHPVQGYSSDPRAPIVEVPGDKRFVKPRSKKGGYRATVGEENAVRLSDRGVRVFQPAENGVRMLYDNATPWKYYGRQGVRTLGKAAVPLAAGLDAADVANVALDPRMSKADVATEAAGKAARWAGAGVGAAAGAPFLPPLGPVVGGLAGYFGTDAAIKTGRSLTGTDTRDPSATATGLRRVTGRGL